MFEVSPWAVGVLAAAAVLGGVCDAAVVALIVRCAAGLAARQSQVALNFGPVHFGSAKVDVVLIVAFGAVVLASALAFVEFYIPVRLGTNAARQLRLRVFEAFLDATWQTQAAVRQGGLAELLTNQTELAAEFVTAVASGLGAALTFAALTAAAAMVSAMAFLGVAVVGSVLFVVLKPITRAGQRRARLYSAASERFADQVDIGVEMALEVRTYGVGRRIMEAAGSVIEDLRRQRVGMELAGRSIWAAYQNVAIVAVIAALLVLSAFPRLELATLGAEVLILMRALSGGQNFQGFYNHARQRLPFAEKVRDLLTRLEQARPSSGVVKVAAGSTLELRHVWFSYVEGRPVLRGIDLEVFPGELIAVVGESGAGKSTLLQILLRLRQPDRGEFLVGGIPAATLSEDAWTRTVAYVPQETRLLGATVADNIRFYRDLPLEDVIEAARLAGIDADISRMPMGYETRIGQRTDALSGGQRQRLCLARALVGDPQILILDEPTSALDDVSERLVHESLARLRGTVTIFVVAHRPGILRVCDRVLTLRGGVFVSSPAPSTHPTQWVRDEVAVEGAS